MFQADIAPTPRDTLYREGTAQIYRFRPRTNKFTTDLPLLLVPSVINRWYVLDLYKDASLAGAMVEAGIDTFCLDWGVPEDEDRYVTWEDFVAKIGRTVRRVKRFTGAEKVGLLGYCMGGTLSSIYTALNGEDIAALVNLAGPIDFSQGGMLTNMTDPRWFNPRALTESGNLKPTQMQSGFTSLRPTAQISKWVMLADRYTDPKFRRQFAAMEEWAGDNIPFPGAAYVTYIEDLYQDNLLVQGRHYVGPRRVDLTQIDCPVLSIVAERDTICPPPAARALNDLCNSKDNEVFEVKGGHVGAVVGSRAPKTLYPHIAKWAKKRLKTGAKR